MNKFKGKVNKNMYRKAAKLIAEGNYFICNTLDHLHHINGYDSEDNKELEFFVAMLKPRSRHIEDAWYSGEPYTDNWGKRATPHDTTARVLGLLLMEQLVKELK